MRWDLARNSQIRIPTRIRIGIGIQNEKKKRHSSGRMKSKLIKYLVSG